MGFLEWLQGPPKLIAPDSASNYLYAVKHHLASHGINKNSLVSSVIIANQKKGNRNTFLADEHNLKADKRTLPLSVDILVTERPRERSKNPLQELAFFTSLLLGLTMLTRATNYLPIASATYYFDAEHLSFTVPAQALCPKKSRPTFRMPFRCPVSWGLRRILLGPRLMSRGKERTFLSYFGRYIRRTE